MKQKGLDAESYIYAPKLDHKCTLLKEEQRLVKYLNTCKMNYGFTVTQLWQVAYKYAIILNKEVPDKWKEKEEAGEE